MDTLEYHGIKPDIKYYDNINIDEYNNIKNHNFNLKEELKLYLLHDIKSLYQVFNEFNNIIYKKFHINIFKIPTYSPPYRNKFTLLHVFNAIFDIVIILIQNIFYFNRLIPILL